MSSVTRFWVASKNARLIFSGVRHRQRQFNATSVSISPVKAVVNRSFMWIASEIAPEL